MVGVFVLGRDFQHRVRGVARLGKRWTEVWLYQADRLRLNRACYCLINPFASLTCWHTWSC